VLLSQVPSKIIDIRFTPIKKIIRRIGDRDKNIKKIVASVLDILLRELESIVRLLINKI
jgi:histone H3/H4